MSTIVDERVVEMRFDNKHFESNVATSMSSINKLKQSLDMSGASKGLSSVSPAIGDTRKSLEDLEYAAYKTGFRWGDVAHKISSVIEWNVARRAVDAVESSVKNLANSLLGLTAMKTGFGEYETQMGAIQTILANTKKEGTTLDDVNGALDELNTYADKTIYNFTEMTRNIGTFTAAGVKLDTSVQAIKGIANLAAVSGSTSQQASTAMYQLSQAMASGTVKLMDWNSVVNAGMGGQVFQDALKETARVHGIAIDDIISKNGSFRESLHEGWLTTEILTDTLAKFTGDLTAEQLKAQGYTDEQIKGILDLGNTANAAATEVKTFTQLMDTLKEAAQSGWSQTWRILVGDFEEAKELFTDISEVIGGMIGKSAESRNELLENWKVLGGREHIIEALSNVFWGLMDIITPIKEAFREIFPPMTAERLIDITKGIRDLTVRFRLSEKASDNLKRTFRGLFAVLKIATQIISGVFKVVGALLGVFGDVLGIVFGLTGGIGDLLFGLSTLITEGELINKIFSGIATVIRAVGKVVTTLFKFITKVFAYPGLEIFGSLLDGIYEKLYKVRESSDGFGSGLSHAFEVIANAIMDNPIVKFLGSVLKGLKTLLSGVFKMLGNVLGELGHKIATADIMGLLEIMNEIIAGGIGIQVIKWLKNLNASKEGIMDLIDGVNDVLGSLSSALKGFSNSLNAAAIKDIAIAIAILAAAVLVLSLIDPQAITDASAAILVLFGGLMGTMAVLTKTTSGGSPETMLAGAAQFKAMTTAVIGISIGILILASALKKIRSMDMDEIGRGLLGIAGLMTILTVSIKVLSSSSSKKMVKGATQMIAIALACKILAGVLADVAKLDWEELAIGTIGMIACMAALVGAMKILPLGLNNIGRPFWKFCAQMIIVCKAAKMLAEIIEDLAYLDWNELAVGMTGMVGCMAVLVVAMKILATVSDSNTKLAGGTSKTISHDFMGMAAAIMSLGLAVRIMTPALEEFAAMDWTELGKAGAALVGILAFFTLFALAVKLIRPERITQAANSLLIISASMLILAGALSIFSRMSWESLAKGGAVLLSVAGILMLLGLATKWIKPGTMAAAAASLTILAAALSMLIPSLLILSLMSWESLAKGGAVIVTLTGALMLLGLASKWTNPGAIATLAASLAIFAVALQMLVVPLLIFSNLSWGALATAGVVLLGLIGALMLLGLVAKVFKPLVPFIYKLCAALTLFAASMALIGVSIGLIGIGLTLFGAGLSAFGAAIVTLLYETIAALEVVVVGIVELVGKFLDALFQVIVDCAKGLGEAINALLLMICDVLVDGVAPLVEAILILITKVLDQLVRYAPGIVESLAELIVGVLQSLVKYIQPIVEVLIDILIAVFDGIAARAPELIVSFVNIFIAIFDGLGAALSNLAPDVILQAVLSIGVIALLMKTFASVSGFGPAALKGVLWAGLIFAEISALMAAIGLLAQIPGYTWLINEGGEVLEAVGGAIGKFVGALVGGFGAGVASMLPEIAGYLSDFMVELQPFIDSVKKVDGDVLTSTLTLIATMLAFNTGGLITFLTGGILGLGGLVTFGMQLAAFGPWFAKYYESIRHVDNDAVQASANAALALAEMANVVPKMGGLAALFAGENSLSDWAPQLVDLGNALVTYANTISVLDEDSIKNIDNSVSAARSLAELANAIPNQGGLSALLAGDNNFGKWGPDLVVLGESLVAFSASCEGINAESIKVAADAAMHIAELSNAIPNEGGIVSWFTGDNSISKFSGELVTLGQGIKGFSDSIIGLGAENVKVAAEAGKHLVDMTNAIPNSGGVASWFAGENSVSAFANELPILGVGLKGFSDAVTGIVPETMKAAAESAKSLVEMTQCIPNEGGVVSWFAGESSVAKFGDSLGALGRGMANFSTETAGITPDTVKAAADAAKSLAEMTQNIPNEGGVKAWFTGDNSIADFAGKLPGLGKGLKGFSDSVEGIIPENVVAASNAAKSLAEMASVVPNEGGIKAWFSGDNNIADFAGKLPKLGEGLKGFSDAVVDIKPEQVSSAADAAKSLAQMAETAPENSDKIITFGTNLETFGTKLSSYFSKTKNISEESINASAKTISAIKDISSTDVSGLNKISDAVDKVANSIKNLENVPKDATSSFVESLGSLGEKSVEKFKDAFDGLEDDLKKVGKNSIDEFVEGVNNKKSSAEKACRKLAEACVDEIEDKKKEFETAGKALAQGLADGISANSYKAEAKAKAMAEAALEAARKALDINSPSKVFRALGYSVPEGFAAGIDKFSWMASDSSIEMTDRALDSVKNGIKRIADSVNSDIDTQPTIRPVLDLTDVKSGAGAISSMFGAKSLIGVSANVGSISHMMNQRNQNGANSDLVSEIKALRKDMKANTGTTNIINGVTYDDGSNIRGAVEDIVRAARIERRM